MALVFPNHAFFMPTALRVERVQTVRGLGRVSHAALNGRALYTYAAEDGIVAHVGPDGTISLPPPR